MKTYYTIYGCGKCKYMVNYNNGVSMHKDGSLFYDIALFNNKSKMKEFIKKLKDDGYISLSDAIRI